MSLTFSATPAGITVHFSSTTLTAATAVTATISAGTGAVAGNSTITFTGSGGGLTRSASIALTVIANPIVYFPWGRFAPIIGTIRRAPAIMDKNSERQ